MTFLPESGWGLAYLIAMTALTCHSMAGRRFQLRIWAVLWANWLAMRSIDALAPENFGVWVVSDICTICAFGLVRRWQAGVCAALFVIVLNFDLWTLLYGGSFDGAASVAEAIGYLCMVIGWGASFDETQHSIFSPFHSGGRVGHRYLVSSRVPLFSTPKVPSGGVAGRNQETPAGGA